MNTQNNAHITYIFFYNWLPNIGSNSTISIQKRIFILEINEFILAYVSCIGIFYMMYKWYPHELYMYAG